MAQTQAQVQTHDLKSQGQRIRLLPHAAPGPADLDGRTESHKLMVIGHWNDEVESHLLSFADLVVTSRASNLLSTDLSLLGTWECGGLTTDIQVSEMGAGEVVVAVASHTGSLLLCRLLIPRTPGSTPDDIQLLLLPKEDEASARLAPQWESLHQGAISSVDIQPVTKALLTAGCDGALCVVDPQGPQGEVQPFARSQAGCASYTNGRWADSNTFATTSALGGLQLWDLRVGPKPTATSPAEWGPTGVGRPSQLPLSGPPCCHWLAVHPSRPNCAATGAAGGEVAVWDLRLTAAPVVTSAPDAAAADVWEVHFDPLQASSSAALPSVLYCTEAGSLGIASAPPAPPASQQQPMVRRAQGGASAGFSCGVLHQGAAAINSLDAGGQLGADIVAVNDNQELLYIRRQG